MKLGKWKKYEHSRVRIIYMDRGPHRLSIKISDSRRRKHPRNRVVMAEWSTSKNDDYRYRVSSTDERGEFTWRDLFNKIRSSISYIHSSKYQKVWDKLNNSDHVNDFLGVRNLKLPHTETKIRGMETWS